MSNAHIQRPKIMLINANVLTMDPSFPFANWVAISAGTIRALGACRFTTVDRF